jgi:hypothetical protein
MFIVLISKFCKLNNNNKMFYGKCDYPMYQYININRLHEFYNVYDDGFRILLTPYDVCHMVPYDKMNQNHYTFRTIIPYTAVDQCILSDVYPIYSIKTIKKFNLEITEKYIINLLKNKNKNVLEWLLNNKPSILHQLGYYKKILTFLEKN